MKDWEPQDIKALRDKLKLTQKAFGELIGVTTRYVIYLEQGKKEPSKTLKLLLDCIVREKSNKKGGHLLQH